MFEDLIQWLTTHNVHFEEQDLDVLKQHTRYTEISKNSIIMPQGESVPRLFFLNKGIVRLYRIHNNIDTTIDFISGNEFVSTFVYLLNQAPSTCALETLTDIKALYWERDDILLLKASTTLASQLEEVTVKKLLDWNQDREMDKMSLTPIERYTKLIKTQPLVGQLIPLKYIASYLGIHHDSLSRIRRKLTTRQ